MSEPATVVVGAGLTGTVAALALHRLGHRVSVYERRADPRQSRQHEGRSINLALSTRGLDALDRIGLAPRVLDDAVAMRGRMLHARDGELTFQHYSTNPEHALQSVNRDRLNHVLLDALDEAGIETAFDHKLVDVELKSRTLVFETAAADARREPFRAVIGADGAYSAVRARLQRTERFSYEQSYLEHGYKELTIPAKPGGAFALEPHALHIWPRGNHMMIALPNRDGSFTCTLFWPFVAPGGDERSIAFEHIDTAPEIEAVFRDQFADAVALMPSLVDDYLTNPTSSLVTIRCSPWYLGDEILLLGDAAHAVVPFYGQGANAALEDVTILAERLAAGPAAGAFAQFYAARKPHTDALAELAHDNFVEMRDRVNSPWFRVRQRLGQLLHRLAPGAFVPLYEMVTFSRLPYADAVERDRRQWRRVDRIAVALAITLVAVAAAALLLWNAV